MKIFKDPDPSLNGAPTLTISGAKLKAPQVDSPNFNLPQNVKGLDPQAAANSLKSNVPKLPETPELPTVNNLTAPNISVPSLSGIPSVPSVPSVPKFGGLGKNWTPNQYNPQSLYGNTKFVNPMSGNISSTADLAKNAQGKLSDAKNSITSTTDSLKNSESVKNAQSQLDLVKKDLPSPKIQVPDSGLARVKTIKVKNIPNV